MAFAIEPLSLETVVIRVGETLDLRTAPTFKAACREQFRSGPRNFILDFSRTKVLDSTGLGAILALYRQVAPLEGTIVFVSVTRPVQLVVRLTRLSRLFRQYPSVETAYNALS